MSRAVAILGKSGTGKTFVAAHLAAAFGYLGERTLVVGCDPKRDTAHALAGEQRPALMEALEAVGFAHDRLDLAEVLLPAGPYVDLVELGAPPLLVGSYADMLDEAFHAFGAAGAFEGYAHVIFDVGDDRFDAAVAPLFRRVEAAVGVADESIESLVVFNRLLRAALLGSYDHGYPLRVLGAVHNRAVGSVAFDRYVERTRCFPLLRIPADAELARLRPFHRTLFSAEPVAEAHRGTREGFVRIADLLRGQPFNLYPVMPLEDDAVWRLAPPVTRPN